MRKIIFTSHAEFWQVCYDGAPCPCRPFQESHSLCQEYVPNTHNRREGEIVDADLSCSFRLRKASLIRLLSGAGSHEPLGGIHGRLNTCTSAPALFQSALSLALLGQMLVQLRPSARLCRELLHGVTKHGEAQNAISSLEESAVTSLFACMWRFLGRTRLRPGP